MPEIKQFEDLDIWKKARELTCLIYEVSSKNDFGKDFGLRDQIRRASVSIYQIYQRDLKGETIKNLYDFCHLQKVLVVS